MGHRREQVDVEDALSCGVDSAARDVAIFHDAIAIVVAGRQQVR